MDSNDDLDAVSTNEKVPPASSKPRGETSTQQTSLNSMLFDDGWKTIWEMSKANTQ